MTTTSQLPPLAEQRAALNAAWLQMERAEAERELLMELLRECRRGIIEAIGAKTWTPESKRIMANLEAVLRGEPVAAVLRPDEDPDMEVGF